MAKTGRLNKLQQKSKFGREYVNKIIDRIETIKPLGGDGILTKETDDGIQINLAYKVTVVTATVCIDGASQQVGLLTTGFIG